MTQKDNTIMNKFLEFFYSPYIIIFIGVILINLSLFFPYLAIIDGTNKILISVNKLLVNFLEKDIIITIILVLLFYPFTYSMLVILFIPFNIKKNKLIHLRKPAILVNYLGMIINFFIYFGWYFSYPRKGVIGLLFGIIIIGTMLFLYYYYGRTIKAQKEMWVKIVYLVARGSWLNLISFILIISIIVYSDKLSLMLGSYISLMGAIFIISGLNLYIYYNKYKNKSSFVDLPE